MESEELMKLREGDVVGESGPAGRASGKSEKSRDIFSLPSTVLLLIGCYDVLRGFMHTFILKWSAANFAKFDLATVPQDQIFMLGVFGISNFLTGFIFLLISRKARELSPYVLIIIPAAYLLGLIGITSGGIRGQAAFDGKYLMMVYFSICIVTFVIFWFQRRKGLSRDVAK